MLVSLPQLLILVDHLLLAILFLLALFCVVAAVSSSVLGTHAREQQEVELEEEQEAASSCFSSWRTKSREVVV